MKLREVGVDLEQETDAAGFLGIQIEHDSDIGLLEMKPEGLTLHIIEAMGLDVGTVTPKWLPAEAAPLVKDSEGAPATGTSRGGDHKIGQFFFGLNDFFVHEWC
jgi:hypothetical protein